MIQSHGQVSSSYNKSLRGHQFFGDGYFKNPTRYKSSQPYNLDMDKPINDTGVGVDKDTTIFIIYLSMLLTFVLGISYYF